MVIYPWLESEWHRLVSAGRQLHHGLLLTGNHGIGKLEFALLFAQHLFCERKTDDGLGCDQCHNCRLFLAGTHPDLHLLTTEHQVVNSEHELVEAYANRYQESTARDKKANPSRVLPVDQVRTLIGHFGTSSHIASHRVALIAPADAMNLSAANALLKLLEEPPGSSTLLLVSDNPGFLPATIRSRCMKIPLAAPVDNVASNWLSQWIPEADAEYMVSLIDAGPLAVRHLATHDFLQNHRQMLAAVAGLSDRRLSGLDAAAMFGKMNFRQVLNWLQRFTSDLIRWIGGQNPPVWQGEITLSIERLSVRNLFFLYDKITFYRKISREPVNEQIVLEDLMLILQRVLR
ncbi:MAG: hypothetical protein AAF402_15740 [Pseudomonadota bacterium]